MVKVRKVVPEECKNKNSVFFLFFFLLGKESHVYSHQVVAVGRKKVWQIQFISYDFIFIFIFSFHATFVVNRKRVAGESKKD